MSGLREKYFGELFQNSSRAFLMSHPLSSSAAACLNVPGQCSEGEGKSAKTTTTTTAPGTVWEWSVQNIWTSVFGSASDVSMDVGDAVISSNMVALPSNATGGEDDGRRMSEVRDEETDGETDVGEEQWLCHIARYVESFEAGKDLWLVFVYEGKSLSSLLYSSKAEARSDRVHFRGKEVGSECAQQVSRDTDSAREGGPPHTSSGSVSGGGGWESGSKGLFPPETAKQDSAAASGESAVLVPRQATSEHDHASREVHVGDGVLQEHGGTRHEGSVALEGSGAAAAEAEAEAEAEIGRMRATSKAGAANTDRNVGIAGADADGTVGEEGAAASVEEGAAVTGPSQGVNETGGGYVLMRQSPWWRWLRTTEEGHEAFRSILRQLVRIGCSIHGVSRQRTRATMSD